MNGMPENGKPVLQSHLDLGMRAYAGRQGHSLVDAGVHNLGIESRGFDEPSTGGHGSVSLIRGQHVSHAH